MNNQPAIYTVSAIRQIEKDHAHEPLMVKAGLVLAHAIEDYCEKEPARSIGTLLFLVGKGNNGGDGLIAATHLIANGFSVEVWLSDTTGIEASLVHTPYTPLSNYFAKGGKVIGKLPDLRSSKIRLIVDALLGIGYSTKDEGRRLMPAPLLSAIHFTHRAKKLGVPIVAVDIPSGLCADSGAIVPRTFYDEAKENTEEALFENAVMADLTVGFIAAKVGYYTAFGPSYCGRVVVDNLGINIPPKSASTAIEIIRNHRAHYTLPIRHSAFHKGLAGSVVIVGGLPPYSGAGVLSANSAQILGAGRVYWPYLSNSQGLNGMFPEIIVGEAALPNDLATNTAILLGVGLGQHEKARTLFQETIATYLMASDNHTTLSLVIDADGINLLAQYPDIQRRLKARKRGPLILTPHPLEAARLLRYPSVSTVQSDRLGAVVALAKDFKAVVVLKGSGSLVANPNDEKIFIQAGSVSALASAGTGDVLSGAIASLLAQGMLPLHAALASVDVHFRAGQLLQDKQGLLLAHELMPVMRQLLWHSP